MKKFAILALVAALTVGLMISSANAADKIRIGVTVIVSHPALENDQKGFEQALADAGFGPDKVEYDYQNAQGEMSNAMQIAQKFKADKVDLVHAIATPTAQAAVKVIKKIPLVYSSVTDPVDAGLVPTIDASGTPTSPAYRMPGPWTVSWDFISKCCPRPKNGARSTMPVMPTPWSPSA